MLHCVVFRVRNNDVKYRNNDVKYLVHENSMELDHLYFLKHFYTSHDFVSVLYDNIPSHVFTETTLKHHSNSKPAQPALPQPSLGCLSSKN